MRPDDGVDQGPDRGSDEGSDGATIGVALSGGGIRAALFSLGALIGVVQMGQAHRVRHLTSVSGASLTNAAVAQKLDLSACATVDDLQGVARPLANLLTWSGMFFISPAAAAAFLKALLRGLTAFGAFGIGLPLVIALANRSELTDWGSGLPHPPWPTAAAILLVAALIGVVLGRGRLQEAVYGAALAKLPHNRRSDTLAALPPSTVHHVFVATDLVSGSPIYFGRDFVFSPQYGWGRPAKLRTAVAVYASAAFPVVFPPRRIRRRHFAFQDGRSAPPYPAVLKLTDGGVHNNLGTDWFEELDRQARSRLWPFGNVSGLEVMAPCDQLVIVNAGAASRGFHRVWPFVSIRRTMTVLYDNTVQPRLNQWREKSLARSGAIVIDINDSPVEMIRSLRARLSLDCEPGGEADRCRERATEVLRLLLSNRDDGYWADFARQTSRTRTKLTRTGVDSGARMLMHGYLSTVAALSITEDLPLPDQLLDEGWFLDLAGRNKNEESPSTTDDVDATVEAEAGAPENPEIVADEVPAAPGEPEIPAEPAPGVPAERVSARR